MYRKNKFFKIIILLILYLYSSVILINVSYASDFTYIWSTLDTLESSSHNTLDIPIVQTAMQSTDNVLDLVSGGAILIEQTTGKVLYEHNSHEMFRPASVTKVMSLLLIMEALDNRSNLFNR